MQSFSKNPEFIKSLFNKISKDYDKLNDIMSLGLHRRVKQDVIKKIKDIYTSPIAGEGVNDFNLSCASSPLTREVCFQCEQESANVRKQGDGYLKILDLCTGTGDIANLLKQKFPNAQITGVDFSDKMLEIAQSKHSSIEFLQADCTQLPFEDNSFDICTISFGLRNIENIEQAISEIYRVLKPGGIFVNIDLGKPNKFFNLFFKPYMYIWVAMLGKIFHGDETPYKYLAKSNENFPHPKKLVEMCEKKGFSSFKNLRIKNYALGQISTQFFLK